MRFARVASLATVVALVAACSGGGTSSPSIRTSAAASSALPPSAARIEVKLTDALRMEPASMTVRAGQPMTFVVTNMGAIDHEFFVGDEAAQMTHDHEMTGMTGMTADQVMGIGVKPGETKELTVTFPAAGTMFAGCHVSGHYAAGMKATMQVTN